MDRGKSIFLTGFMGCGKTTVGKLLSEKLRLPFVDLDQYIEHKTGRTVASIFTEYGEDRFRKMENEALLEILISIQPRVVALGGGTICYYNAVDSIKARGRLLYLKTDTETLYNRLLNETSHRPLLGDNLKDFIEKKLQDRKPFYEQSDYAFDASGKPEQIAEQIAGYILSEENKNP